MEEKMSHFYIVSITLAILAALPVCVQAESAEEASPCVVEPIFHCVQHLDGGKAIAHFGYNLQCPGDAGPESKLFVDNDDNLFSPGRKARGQTSLFLPGEHVDEFEADYTLEEINAGSGIHWTVLDKTVTVDFSKTKDGLLDCSALK
jgi:hypothetical protein